MTTTHFDERETREHDGHEGARGARSLGDAEIVDDRQREDRGDRQRSSHRRRCIERERQRHRGAARELADDEAPAGDEAPERIETLATVDVGPSRLGVQRREGRRRRGVTVGDERCDQEPGQQTLACRARGGREHREDAGAEHRPEADDDGIRRSELAREARGRIDAGRRRDMPCGVWRNARRIIHTASHFAQGESP